MSKLAERIQDALAKAKREGKVLDVSFVKADGKGRLPVIARPSRASSKKVALAEEPNVVADNAVGYANAMNAVGRRDLADKFRAQHGSGVKVRKVRSRSKSKSPVRSRSASRSRSRSASRAASPAKKRVGRPKKTEAQKKADRKEKAAKRPLTAYQLYFKSVQPQLKAQGLAPTDVLRQVAANWRAASASEKARYQQRAEPARERYMAEKETRAKRPQTSYIRWANQVGRAQVMREFGRNLTVPEVGRRLGQMWKAMSASAKAPYERAYEAEKAQLPARSPRVRKAKSPKKAVAAKPRKARVAKPKAMSPRAMSPRARAAAGMLELPASVSPRLRASMSPRVMAARAMSPRAGIPFIPELE